MRSVIFLRAINTGSRRIRMADLRQAFVGVGFADPRTHLATGNVIVDSEQVPQREMIERLIEQSFGFTAEAFIRSDAEVRAVLEGVPWSLDDHVVEVSFLERVPTPDAARALEASVEEPEGLVVAERHVYFLREGRGIDTVHKESTTERMLGCRTTRRGMATIAGIVDRHLGPG